MRKSGEIVECKDGYVVKYEETLFASHPQDAEEWLLSEGVKEADIRRNYGTNEKDEVRGDDVR